MDTSCLCSCSIRYLKGLFEMVPEFDRSSVKLIFADDFINDSVLEQLGMKTTAILCADLWHLTHEQLPKYFGGFWNNRGANVSNASFRIKGRM
jgi:hypothetical protein